MGSDEERLQSSNVQSKSKSHFLSILHSRQTYVHLICLQRKAKDARERIDHFGSQCVMELQRYQKSIVIDFRINDLIQTNLDV